MKTVCLKIQVPKCEYCWDARLNGPSCEYFDNEGGHAHCELGFYNTYNNKTDFYEKGPECMALQEC